MLMGMRESIAEARSGTLFRKSPIDFGHKSCFIPPKEVNLSKDYFV